MSWYKVSNQTEISTPFIKKVVANGKAVCLVNTGSAVYAVSATCPHAGADLSRGSCHNGKLVCPFHRYAYDLSTGKGEPGQNDFIAVYPLQIREDGIYVEVRSWVDKIKGLFNFI